MANVPQLLTLMADAAGELQKAVSSRGGHLLLKTNEIMKNSFLVSSHFLLGGYDGRVIMNQFRAYELLEVEGLQRAWKGFEVKKHYLLKPAKCGQGGMAPRPVVPI